MVRTVIRGRAGEGKILRKLLPPTPRVPPLDVFRSVGAHLPFVRADHMVVFSPLLLSKVIGNLGEPTALAARAVA